MCLESFSIDFTFRGVHIKRKDHFTTTTLASPHTPSRRRRSAQLVHFLALWRLYRSLRQRSCTISSVLCYFALRRCSRRSSIPGTRRRETLFSTFALSFPTPARQPTPHPLPVVRIRSQGDKVKDSRKCRHDIGSVRPIVVWHIGRGDLVAGVLAVGLVGDEA